MTTGCICEIGSSREGNRSHCEAYYLTSLKCNLCRWEPFPIRLKTIHCRFILEAPINKGFAIDIEYNTHCRVMPLIIPDTRSTWISAMSWACRWGRGFSNCSRIKSQEQYWSATTTIVLFRWEALCGHFVRRRVDAERYCISMTSGDPNLFILSAESS